MGSGEILIFAFNSYCNRNHDLLPGDDDNGGIRRHGSKNLGGHRCRKPLRSIWGNFHFSIFTFTFAGIVVSSLCALSGVTFTFQYSLSLFHSLLVTSFHLSDVTIWDLQEKLCPTLLLVAPLCSLSGVFSPLYTCFFCFHSTFNLVSFFAFTKQKKQTAMCSCLFKLQKLFFF